MIGACVRVTSDVDAGTYRAFIASCRSALVQQSWEWRAVVTSDARNLPVYFLAFDDDGTACGALPAFEFRGAYGSLLLSVPHAGGYGGVVVDRALPQAPDISRALLEAFTAESVRRGCLLATIASAPFFADVAADLEQFQPDFIRENFFQYIDLASGSAAESSEHVASKYVKRATAAKAKFGLRTVFTDSDAHFDAWYALHEERMAEVDATPLPRPFLQSIRENVLSVGNGTMCYVLNRDTVIAGCMFVGQHDVLDCFMLAGSVAAMKSLATSVLVVDALAWARAAGFRWFNWQSSSSRASGVYQFKHKWGSREGQHHYLTKITGDIAALRRVPLDVIRREYRWHYVMPFEEFVAAPHTST